MRTLCSMVNILQNEQINFREIQTLPFNLVFFFQTMFNPSVCQPLLLCASCRGTILKWRLSDGVKLPHVCTYKDAIMLGITRLTVFYVLSFQHYQRTIIWVISAGNCLSGLWAKEYVAGNTNGRKKCHPTFCAQVETRTPTHVWVDIAHENVTNLISVT